MAVDLLLFSPEIALLVGALLVFVLSIAERRGGWVAGLLAAAVAVGCATYTLPLSGEPFFPGIYRVDAFSQLLKLGLAVGLLLVLLLTHRPQTVRPSARPDLPFFLLLSTTGMMMLVSATELLTLYVALELAAYGLYIAVALHSQPRPGGEAAAKYVLFGAASSAVTLYGISLVFGTAQTTYLAPIAAIAANGSGLLMVGLLLMLSGFLFKLALVPFHFWAPDTYEGAPHEVVAFLASASKVAAVGILARACSIFGSEPQQIVEIFTVVAVLSMTLGNLAALAQRDLKRLLAYSAIGHAGYLMLGFGAFGNVGIASAVFYGIVYMAVSVLAFVVVCAIGRDGSNPTLESIAGLYQRSPLLALLLLCAMFGLGGVPPTAGFIGKWYLFAAAIERGQFVLVLIAAINSTIGLYYYLRVVKAAYLDPPDGRPAIPVGPAHALAGGLALALVLVVGVYPAPLWALARAAAGVLFPLS